MMRPACAFVLALFSVSISVAEEQTAGQTKEATYPAATAAPSSVATLCNSCCFDFSKVPSDIRGINRPGLFPEPPSGPGYYSLLDACHGCCRDAPPKYPYPPVILSPLPQYDADWRFVDDPKYNPDFLERLKRIHIGDNWLLNTGGQVWHRYQNEYNARMTNTDNVSNLVRVRPYFDFWYQDKFRFYIEGIYAENVGQTLPPLPNDNNFGDFQNFFMDFKVGEHDYARIGRQEIQLGSARLLGIPDWGNTRRVFQGARLMHTTETFNFHLTKRCDFLVGYSYLWGGDFLQNTAGPNAAVNSSIFYFSTGYRW